MHRWLAVPAILFLCGVAAGCRIDDLVHAPSHDSGAAPGAVIDSAAVGSRATRSAQRALSATGATSWQASSLHGSAWLSLGTGGSLPDTLSVTLDPAGLTVGSYDDTVLVSFDAADAQRIPVHFVVQPCRITDLAPGTSVSATLDASDCGAPQRAGRSARLYRIHGNAGDSLTLNMDASGFAGYLIVDSAAASDAAPLAQTDRCRGATGDPCLPYVLLPRSGDYVVESTTALAGAAGSFTLAVNRPRAPGDPVSPSQLRDDSTTIAAGAAIGATSVILRANLNDADLADTLVLEVELRRLGTAFTGAATATSAVRAGDGAVAMRVSGLSDSSAYHWQSRTVDQTGRASAWSAFGANAETAADFRVAMPALHLAFGVQPSSVAAGSNISPAVQLRVVDGSGTTATTFTGTVTVALGTNPAGGTLSGTTSVAASAGVATFSSLRLDKAGSGYTLVASASGPGSVTSASFNVSPGAATQLQFIVQPVGIVAGASFSPAVEVRARDAFGNVATGFTGAVTLGLAPNGTGAVTSGTTTASASAGVARFTAATVNTAGSGYALVATSGAMSATSNTFSVSAGAVSQLSFVVQPSDVGVNQPISPPVQVAASDAFGNPVSGFTGTVTISIGTDGSLLGNAKLTGTTSVQTVNGVATFAELRIDQIGTGYTLRAVSGAASSVSAAFAVAL